MNKKNIGYRYFDGGKDFKKWLAVSIALIAVGVILYELWWYGVIWGVFVWLLSPLPILIGVMMLIVQLTGRISDHNYDEYMQGLLTKLWSEKSDSEASLPDQTVTEYSIQGEEIARKKKGKDKKVRTDVLCRTELFFEQGTLRVKQGKVNADGENGLLQSVTIPCKLLTAAIVTKESDKFADLKKEHMLLSCEGQEDICFPIPSNDYDMEALAERINHERTRARAAEQ